MKPNENGSGSNRITPTHALLAVAIAALIVMPIAFAGASPTATTSASAKKQIKSLQKRVTALENQKAPTSLPPNGPAGGDLTGTYPNPTIGANKVTTGKIANAAVTDTKLADNAVTNAKVADNAIGSPEVIDASLGAVDLKDTFTVVSGGTTPGANTYGTQTADCGAHRLLGGGYAWSEASPTSVETSVNAPGGVGGDHNVSTWVVTARNSSATNTLFAWGICLIL